MDYVLQLGKLLLVLGLFVGGCIWIVRKMKEKQSKTTSHHRYMNVVDSMNVGMNQGVYLLRVGEKYVLLSTGNHGVGMMGLDQTEFTDPKEGWDEAFYESEPVVMMKQIKKFTTERLLKK